MSIEFPILRIPPLWRLPVAQKIARALRLFNTFWHDDAIRIDSLDPLRRYVRDCEALICASETLSHNWCFKDFLQTGAAGVVMPDLHRRVDASARVSTPD